MLRRIADFVLKHTAWCLIGLWGVSLACKLLAWYMEPAVGRDASFYLLTVQQWYDSGEYPVFWVPPGLFVFIRAFMLCGFSAETAGLIVNIGLGSAIVFICYGIAWESTRDKKIALFSALFATFHPGINDLSIEIQRDIPYLFFAGVAVWCAIAAFKRKKWYLWSLAGAALALSFVTRYETAEFVLLFPVAIFVQAVYRRISWKQAAFHCGILMLSVIAAVFAFLYISGTQQFLFKFEPYYISKFTVVKQSLDNEGK